MKKIYATLLILSVTLTSQVYAQDPRVLYDSKELEISYHPSENKITLNGEITTQGSSQVEVLKTDIHNLNNQKTDERLSENIDQKDYFFYNTVDGVDEYRPSATQLDLSHGNNHQHTHKDTLNSSSRLLYNRNTQCITYVTEHTIIHSCTPDIYQSYYQGSVTLCNDH